MADNTIQTATDEISEARCLRRAIRTSDGGLLANGAVRATCSRRTVAEIAHDYAGKLKVMKLNVDEAMNSAGRYRVQGIPHMLLFKNGQVRRADCGSSAERADHQGAGAAYRRKAGSMPGFSMKARCE